MSAMPAEPPASDYTFHLPSICENRRRHPMADQNDNSNSGMFDIELLLKQARTYLAFGEQTRQFAEQFQDNIQNETDWGSALRGHFDQFREAIAQSAQDPGVNPELARLWTLTLETWQQATASLGVPLAAPDDRNAAAWLAYQRTQNEYLELLRRAALEALDLMEQRLGERAIAGETIGNLRELYNLWVDCNEETYGRMLRGPEYSEISGRLLNALFACYRKGETPP